ncbi:MAG TPA: SapB/AmfS family lanthipeptide [Solirubrobacteraceae bacterium]|nr:SapB/AmfS family lanthipeptide [Solirubrobacteraceae bacterium]
MAILDLQGLETPQKTHHGGKSGASKGCTIGGGGGGPSRLSLLLC